MNNPFNLFMPDTRDQNWVNRIQERYQNPQKYKEHLKKQADEDWEQSKKGGVSEEMSIKEAQRKKQVAEDKRRREEEERIAEEKRIADEKRIAEEKRIAALGPNFPKVWDLSYVREDPQKIFRKKMDDTLDWDFFIFKAYVDENNFFMTKFYENPDELKWKNTEKVKDIRKSKFDIKQNFFNSVASMYVLTWRSGFSIENVKCDRNTKVITSLCKFYFYFWFKRFQKQPALLEKHLTRADYKFLISKLKLYHTWDHKYEQTGRVWGSQVKKLNDEYGHRNWDSLRSVGRYGSGYTFRVINQTLPVSPEKQYIRFIRPTSNGLNSLGQTFLMQSIEAFIYSVLGAQANSHFSIVNQEGRSYQTQTIFPN